MAPLGFIALNKQQLRWDGSHLLVPAAKEGRGQVYKRRKTNLVKLV